MIFFAIEEDYENGVEPTMAEIDKYMEKYPDINWYNARERLREKAYGGKPPHGFASWGDFWKSY